MGMANIKFCSEFGELDSRSSRAVSPLMAVNRSLNWGACPLTYLVALLACDELNAIKIIFTKLPAGVLKNIQLFTGFNRLVNCSIQLVP